MSIIGIAAGRRILALMQERDAWRARLRLAYECAWSIGARRIIESELRRIDAEIIATREGN